VRSDRPSLPWRVLAHAAVYAAALAAAMPLLWMIVTSLKADDEVAPDRLSLWPRAWQWSNYAEAIRAANLDRFFMNSLVAAVLTTVLAGFYNAAAGFALAKLRFRGRRTAIWLVLAAMMLPVQASFIVAYIIAARLGMVDNMQALVVPFIASAFGIFYMKQAVSAVPDSLLEAGRLDGMTDLDLFWHLVLPAIWPATAALGTLSFVNSWNSFLWPLVVADSESSKTLPIAIAELAGGVYVQSWPVRMAAATLITLPLVVVFLLFQRAFVRGVTLSGVKE